MLLSLVLLNVLSHNCDDIYFKVICDSHDKCLWKNYNCIDTTTISTTTSSKSKKLSGKKSSYKYSTTTTEEPGGSLSNSKTKKTKTKTTTEDTTSSSTSTDTQTISSSTSTTTKASILIPPIDSTSDKPSDTSNGSSIGKSGNQSSVKDIIIPSVVAGCISFLVVFLVYRRKRNAKDSPDIYLEPVTKNPAYSSPNEQNETETNTALYALAKTGENLIYDLSYEQIQTEQPRYEIPEPAYNLAQDIPPNKPVYSTATQQVITEPEYDLAEDETGYFEVGNQ